MRCVKLNHISARPMVVKHVRTHATPADMKSSLLQANNTSPQNNYASRGRYVHTNGSGSNRPDPSPHTQSDTSNEEPADPEKHGSYKGLLLHPKWKQRRKEILLRDDHACVNCGSRNDLQVHHRQYHFVLASKQYKAPWDYPDRLMITLCIPCHSQGHSKFKVPIIKL